MAESTKTSRHAKTRPAQTSRRDMLSMLPLAGGAALALLNGLGQAQEPATADQANVDQSNYDFWTQNVRNPDFGGPGTRDVGSGPRASFVYYDDHNGFVTGSDIGDVGLPDDGDLDVLVNVDHVRPSVADQARFLNLEGGTLRIDLQQNAPLPRLAERLAWTAIAGFLPENKQLPTVKEMTFNPGDTWGKLQTVPLPGAGGSWTWNFFLQKRKSRWMQMFEVIRRYKGLAAPIFGLGLPAIAITALATVDSMVGEITKEERTEWLFQSPDVYFYASKKARDAFEGSMLRLKKGMYAIMPSSQLAEFAKAQSGLTIKDGLIVPKNTSSLEVEAAAKDVIQDITYLTVGVTTRFRAASAASR